LPEQTCTAELRMTCCGWALSGEGGREGGRDLHSSGQAHCLKDSRKDRR
jgi:hypothetical protein